MKIHKCFTPLLFVLCIILAANLIRTQDDQSGFLSIDCGIPNGSKYTDPTTGLFYISDADFVNGGLSQSISHIYLTDSTAEQYATVRSFPEGTRHCYTLRLPQGKDHKYLIRAGFLYGNYDGKDQPPLFDLYLGVDLWEKMNFTDASIVKYQEIVYVPSADYIHICFEKVGNYTPFVSTLELRVLEETMYATTDKSLNLAFRMSFPLGFGNLIRFKDDIYDRLWKPGYLSRTFFDTSTTTFFVTSTTNFVDTSNETLTRPPPKVMSTAWVPPPSNDTGNLSFFWDPVNITTDKFYIFMYFADIEEPRDKQLREFNIYLNGRLWYGPIVPEYLKAKTIHKPIPEEGHQVYEFDINKTDSSFLSPLLNAIEVFRPIELSESRTEDINVAAMLEIKSRYKLIRNWQGDPCVPQTYLWDGLNCSYNGQNTATIISLNLSSYGLKGTIAPSISNLTALQMLDLSNNNLTGQVPEFLAELPSLKVLILKGNSLTGANPERLLEKSKDGTLSLSIDDQDQWGETGENHSSNGKNIGIILIIASLAAAVLMV